MPSNFFIPDQGKKVAFFKEDVLPGSALEDLAEALSLRKFLFKDHPKKLQPWHFSSSKKNLSPVNGIFHIALSSLVPLSLHPGLSCLLLLTRSSREGFTASPSFC